MNKEDKTIINNEQNDSEKGGIGGWIFLIWFIGSIIALVCFSKINPNPYYCVMTFGQYFLVFGIIFLKTAKKGAERVIPILFGLIGLSCIIIPYLMMKPEINGIEINWETVIKLLFVILFIIAGLMAAFMPIIRIKKLKNKCSIEVEATIIKNDVFRPDGRKLYCPVYEFEFNGKKYEVMNEQYTNTYVNPVGTKVNLKINPDNPKEFLDKEVVSIGFITMGVITLIVSIQLLIIVLKDASFIK